MTSYPLIATRFRSKYKTFRLCWVLINMNRIEALLCESIQNYLMFEAIDQTISILKRKYPGISPDVVDSISIQMPEQALEWVVKSISNKSGRWPEDKPRFTTIWELFSNGREFKNKSKRLFADRNSNNPLEFTLHDFESVEDALKPQDHQKSKREQVKELKSEGAKTILDRQGWKVIEVTSGEASEYYARGTRWCTSDKETANDYLKEGPLYVIIHNGEKKAQYHPESQQITNIKDRPLMVNNSIVKILNAAKAPLNFDVLNISERLPKYEKELLKRSRNEPAVWRNTENPSSLTNLVHYWMYVINNDGDADTPDHRWPEAEEIFVKNPTSACMYACGLKEKWPEAEPIIAADSEHAYEYAMIFNERFKAGEPAIKTDTMLAANYARHFKIPLLNFLTTRR